MGTMKDVVDFVNGVRADAKGAINTVVDLTGKSKHASLAKRASEGTLQFPIIISSSIDIETAQLVTKALERNYSTFAQIAFSMSPTMKYHDGVSAGDYLKRFHQNSPKANMLELISREGANLADSVVIEDENFVILGATYEGTTAKITANNKEQLIDLLEHVRQDSLNNKYIPRDTNIYNFKNKETNARFNSVVKEAPYSNTWRYGDANINFDQIADAREYQQVKDMINYNYRRDADNRGLEYRQNQDAISNASNRERNAIQRQNLDRQIRQDEIQMRSTDLSKNMLQDNDVRKANELISTTLHVRVRLINDNEESVGILDFIVGIKGIMHPVKSEEMITNVLDACKNEGKLFNFLRWTTGEISFFKDFLFNIKELKSDIAKDKNSSQWWLAMKRRRELASLSDKITGGVLPNSTIVMSAEEAAFIETEYGYDITNKMSIVRRIMQRYYLLGFVIVDNAAQYVKFIFDGDSDFQTVSFSALERAGSNDERKFKEMLKAMNRI